MASVLMREQVDNIRDKLLEIKGMLLGASYFADNNIPSDFLLDIVERIDDIFRDNNIDKE